MHAQQRIVAIVPARYGSTRLPGKPLIDLAGKPMIQHVCERTKQAKLVDRVIVATDDRRIADAVIRFGGEAVMTPVGLRSGSDRVAYAVRGVPDAEIIVNVQGDEPLIDPAMIDEAVQPLVDDAGIEVGTLVKRLENDGSLDNPNIVKVALDEKGFAVMFSRSPASFHRGAHGALPLYKHIGLYVFRREFLVLFSAMSETPSEKKERLEQLRILEHGHKIKARVTERDSTPIDTPEDVEKVRMLLQRVHSARTVQSS